MASFIIPGRRDDYGLCEHFGGGRSGRQSTRVYVFSNPGSSQNDWVDLKTGSHNLNFIRVFQVDFTPDYNYLHIDICKVKQTSDPGPSNGMVFIGGMKVRMELETGTIWRHVKLVKPGREPVAARCTIAIEVGDDRVLQRKYPSLF